MALRDKKGVHTQKEKVFQILLAVLSLMGMGVSIALTQHYYEVRSGMGSFHSYCNFGTTLNCDAVAASPYAEVFHQLPLSAFAAGWFFSIFFIAALAFFKHWKKEALRFCVLLTLIGSILCLSYLAVMIGVLKTYCLFCLVTDVLMLAALGMALKLRPHGFLSPPFQYKQIVSLGLFVLGFLSAFVWALHAGMSPLAYDSTEMDRYVDQFIASPVFSVASKPQGPAFGPSVAAAPISIVEFSDFQCPYCRLGALSVHAVMARYPGKIRMEFRNYPLDQKCNPDMTVTVHPMACEAARVAYCAHQQGHFEATYEALFENQTQLAPGRAIEFSKATGVDVAALQKCMDSPEAALALAQDAQEGKSLGVQGTPIFFVNGHKIEGTIPLMLWSRIIERFLENGAHATH